MSNFPRPRIRKTIYGDTLIDGMYYMGGNRIPPLPVHIIMTDRATGTHYALSHTGIPGSLTLELTTPDAKWTDIAEFGPQDGPYLGDWCLFIENGILSAQQTTQPQNSLRVFTRKAFERSFLEITVNNSGDLVYTQVTV